MNYVISYGLYLYAKKNEIFMNAEIDITKIVFVTLCEW